MDACAAMLRVPINRKVDNHDRTTKSLQWIIFISFWIIATSLLMISSSHSNNNTTLVASEIRSLNNEASFQLPGITANNTKLIDQIVMQENLDSTKWVPNNWHHLKKSLLFSNQFNKTTKYDKLIKLIFENQFGNNLKNERKFLVFQHINYAGFTATFMRKFYSDILQALVSNRILSYIGNFQYAKSSPKGKNICGENVNTLQCFFLPLSTQFRNNNNFSDCDRIVVKNRNHKYMKCINSGLTFDDKKNLLLLNDILNDTFSSLIFA
eukprot:252743_1